MKAVLLALLALILAASCAEEPDATGAAGPAGAGGGQGGEGGEPPADVAEILSMGGKAFDKSQYLAGIVAYYSKPDGTMLSFPYNSSSPVLYYNKDIFQKAGLDVARRRAYDAVARIRWRGEHHRSDIAADAVERIALASGGPS